MLNAFPWGDDDGPCMLRHRSCEERLGLGTRTQDQSTLTDVPSERRNVQ
jgi:hypothetical protein